METAKELDWNEKLETGISEIDFQHKYFLELIKKFIEIQKKHTLPEKIKPYLKELTLYARFHFYSEENYMNEINYPELDEHKLIHIQLIEELSNIFTSFEMKHSKIDELTHFLISWFYDHTLKEDIKISNFIKGE